MVTAMLKLFSIDVYFLLDPGATLSYVTPFVAKKFHVLPDILNEHFIVSNPWINRLLQRRSIEIII